ncbi:MAG TPA: DUF1269 domain-containing protein [Burkholderiaceae bacterium]|jgi:hypothetical protein|nr:DUF1269 domain-containing protein [Burkholderiaceae bacterium]
MRRRLYFVLPDLACAIRTANDLLLARIDDKYMHFVGRDGMSLGELHAATVAQTSDLRQSLQLGAGIGLVGGLLLGTYLMIVPPDGLDLGVGTLIGCTIFGGMFGSWASTLIGLSVPSKRLEPFKREIDAGKIVLLVDVPAERVEEVHKLVQRQSPDVTDRGEDPAIPAFP